jgi:osmoprotectant transport system permease protein
VLRVDLPLAMPAIIAGLRIATVTTVGLVTVASLVGKGGFGNLINDGLSRDFSTPVVVGTVLSVALAIAFDVMFVALERFATPWTRRDGGRGERRVVPIDPGQPVTGGAPTGGAVPVAAASQGASDG